MKSYAVQLHPQAQRDIDKAKAREEQRDSSWPDMIDDALEAASLRLSQFPEIGHRVEIDGVWSLTTRSYAVGETGFVLRYKVDHERQRIVLTRFRHERQRPLKR
jgi:plasmid stabilization system protein ParE